MTEVAIPGGGLPSGPPNPSPRVTLNNASRPGNSSDAGFKLPACYLNPNVPTTGELLTVIMSDPWLIFLMVAALLLAFCTILMYIEGQIYICRRIPGRRKVHLSFIFSLYPVFSATSLCGFYIPKAHIVAKFTSEIWLCLVLFQFVLLVSEYYGTREKMLSALHGAKIPLAGPPCCCCCCCCLPTMVINEKNVGKFVRRVKIMVLQVAVLRPILWFIAIILWINGNYNEGSFTATDAYPYMTVVALVSNLVALQALVTFFKISQDPLASYRVKPKFFTVQLVLVITSIQGLLTGILAKVGVIQCLGPYNPGVREKIIVNFTVIVEMFVFMILAALWYRRVEGNVDHDLIERQTYKRLSKAYYKKNPAEQIALSNSQDAPSDSCDTAATAPSPAKIVQPADSVWQYKVTAVGNGSAIAQNGWSAKAREAEMERAPSSEKEAFLNNNCTSCDRRVTHVQPSSSVIMDNFASSRETDV